MSEYKEGMLVGFMITSAIWIIGICVGVMSAQ